MANYETPKNSKRKGTKAALAASFAALLLCGATLVGTTFAWFTDTATTGNNKIQAGELGINLKLWNGATYQSIEDGVIFNTTTPVAQNVNTDTLWEPGKTQVAWLAIENTGNLHLKYEVQLETTDVASDDGEDNDALSNVMRYQVIPMAMNGLNANSTPLERSNLDWNTNGKKVTPGVATVSEGNDTHIKVGNTHYFALAIHMDENAGNEYMNEEVNFKLNVYATQHTAERDSFNNQYDFNAQYDYELAKFSFTSPAEAIAFCPKCYDKKTTANHANHDDFGLTVKDGVATITKEGPYIGQADLDWENHKHIIEFGADFTDLKIGDSVVFDCGERKTWASVPILVTHTNDGYQIYGCVSVDNKTNLLGTSNSPEIAFKYTFVKDSTITMRAEVAGHSYEKTSKATNSEIYWDVYTATKDNGTETFANLDNFRIYSEAK